MFFVSTVKSPVFLSDLDAMEISHPTTNLLLDGFFTKEEIKKSKSLKQAESRGLLTILDTEYSFHLFRNLMFRSDGWLRLRENVESWRLSEFMAAVSLMDNFTMTSKVMWNAMINSLDVSKKPTPEEIQNWINISNQSKASILPLNELRIVFLNNGIIQV